MIYPKFLKQNGCIGVPAPSDGADCVEDINRYKNAKTKLENLGFKVMLSNNLYNSNMARSANADVRGKELNDMIENPEIDMILCATGGEFLVEMLPYVDFEKLVKSPKFVEGFSDPTGLLFPITTKYDIATIYGTNFSSFGMENYHNSLYDNLSVLQGDLKEQRSFDLFENERAKRVTGLEGYNLDSPVSWKNLNKEENINIKGRVFAGCLDLIDALAGTKYDGAKDFISRYKDDRNYMVL